jgi:lipoate-protein ligase A
LEQEGGKLARRLSGGGAVYHDLGNLNFTFIMDRKLYDLDKQLQVIIEAVNRLGIEAEFSGRNDITVEGRKFSGNAFCFLPHAVYHHGTLLVNTDFVKLSRYLQVSKEKMKAKSIEANSVQSRVVNLASLRSGITIENMKESLEASFAGIYKASPEAITIHTNQEIDRLFKQYSSWEWRLGETPEFDLSLQRRFVWGELDLGISIEEGRITDAVVYSDAMDTSLIKALKTLLPGLPFKHNDLKEKIATQISPYSPAIADDIIKWLESVMK